MNKEFEKIIEKLEKLADELHKAYCIGFHSDDIAEYDAYINAIEIIKQEAEQYNVMIDGDYCFQSCGCTEMCGKCSRIANGDIDWYENIDNWTHFSIKE